MTAARLQSGEGRVLKIDAGESVVAEAVLPSASVLERTLKIDTGDSVGGIDTGDSVEGERSEAVQALGPISGDAGRTSASEGKVNEGASRDMA